MSVARAARRGLPSSMGVAFSSLWISLFGQKELKICILGYVDMC